MVSVVRILVLQALNTPAVRNFLLASIYKTLTDYLYRRPKKPYGEFGTFILPGVLPYSFRVTGHTETVSFLGFKRL